MSLRTPNSSFIFDRLLRSIKLCAVLRAILRPAAVDAVPTCFFLLVLLVCTLAVALPMAWGDLLRGNDVASLRSLSFGFICMILRERVGGGGNAKSSVVITPLVEFEGRLVAKAPGETG